VLCILSGAAATLALMPSIVRVSRDDTSRLCAILDALHSRPAPHLVLFGNSVGMSGVDTRQLGGWNLCSPAQTLGESQRLQRELPKNVNVVVQLVTPLQLAADYGIEPDHENAIRLCSGTATFADRVYARRHVRAAIEGLARDLLRRERSDLQDLYFSASNRTGGWPAEERFAALARGRLPPREENVRRLRSARRYVVVLAPIHPRLPIEVACPAGVDCVDLTRLLGEPEFQDPTHVTRAGASKLTRAIRDALAARGLLSNH